LKVKEEERGLAPFLMTPVIFGREAKISSSSSTVAQWWGNIVKKNTGTIGITFPSFINSLSSLYER
jgi:hypothetical protein